jgi:hypothetical protein
MASDTQLHSNLTLIQLFCLMSSCLAWLWLIQLSSICLRRHQLTSKLQKGKFTPSLVGVGAPFSAFCNFLVDKRVDRGRTPSVLQRYLLLTAYLLGSPLRRRSISFGNCEARFPPTRWFSPLASSQALNSRASIPYEY